MDAVADANSHGITLSRWVYTLTVDYFRFGAMVLPTCRGNPPLFRPDGGISRAAQAGVDCCVDPRLSMEHDADLSVPATCALPS